MNAGAGKAEIVLTDGCLEMEGYTVIHKALHVRAVAVESGSVMLWLSIEITSLPQEEADRIGAQIKERFALKDACIWVCVTHTFSAPHLLPDAFLGEEDKIRSKREYREALMAACMEAARQALDCMEPARFGQGTGYCDVNRNRDVELADGWWLGPDGLGLSDHAVSVIRLERADKTPLAVIFHYGVQSSILDGSKLSAGGRAVTPDLAGMASRYIEKQYEDSATVGMFLMGAAGDQCPAEKTVNETFVQGERIRKDRQEEGFAICERLGALLGETVCTVAEKIQCVDNTSAFRYGKISFCVPGKEMERDLKKLHPVREGKYVSVPDKETEVEAVCIGEMAWVGVKPELNCCSGVALREGSPFRNTFICTMVNGASKYMADRKSYERFTYEAMNSPFGKGAAEILTGQALMLLNNLKKQI